MMAANRLAGFLRAKAISSWGLDALAPIKRRAAKGMSRDVLAEKAGIHPTHVGCVVEHGQALAPKS